MNIKGGDQHSPDTAYPAYRSDLDGLRAIAVLAVIGYHAFPNLFRGGYIGVDIFFVISGFLISSIILGGLENKSFSFFIFYSRRIRRIFPSLILVLITCLTLGWFILLADEYKQLGKHVAAGAGFIANFALWKESGYFGNAAETKPLLHLWSLGIEEQYYIIWPLVLWLIGKIRFNYLVVIMLFLAISFLWNVFNIDRDAIGTFYFPWMRFWELLTGSGLAYFFLYKQDILNTIRNKIGRAADYFVKINTNAANNIVLSNFLSLSGLGMIVSGIIIITKDSVFPGWWALLPTLGTVLIISADRQSWVNRVILSNPLLVWIGLISYPLYLWHWPFLTYARIAENGTISPQICIAIILASTVLAWLTYRFIEKPVRFGKTLQSKTAILLILMIVTGASGYSCFKNEGFEYRFPEIVSNLAKFRYDYNLAYQTGTCFLLPEQDHTSFVLCKSDIKQNRETILLWGDSHAAHLYPGFKLSNNDNFNLVQRTASGCPPLLDTDFPKRAHCRKINDYIFNSIKANKPDKVVLAAYWNMYDWEKISITIDKLRQIGIKNIDLIGPVPQWNVPLPKLLSRQLYSSYKDNKSSGIPDRMQSGLRPNFIPLDTQMAEYSKHLGVNYISPRKIMCNDKGCLTRTENANDSLVAFDYCHLTDKGSQFLVSRFPGD